MSDEVEVLAQWIRREVMGGDYCNTHPWERGDQGYWRGRAEGAVRATDLLTDARRSAFRDGQVQALREAADAQRRYRLGRDEVANWLDGRASDAEGRVSVEPLLEGGAP